MHKVNHILNIILIRYTHTLCVLYAAVQVDGKHALGAGAHATCTQSV